jgi:ubiquinone/menaquinone biosynthesis C-methylase UbiE
MWIVIPIIVILTTLAVWEFWICEGSHLGRNLVVWMYDLAATRYDRIKSFDHDWERRFLGEPLAAAISGLTGARLLDLGAGTGRTARALLPIRPFRGRITCLEPSRKMLSIGRQLTDSGFTDWVRAWAVPLPFAEGTFDVVVSLEILEFTPDPRGTLAEMVRVLCAGGWLLVTNRISWEAPLILGKTFRRDAFRDVLQGLGLQDIEVHPWQVDYDLTWARKML